MRLSNSALAREEGVFQFTHPVWGATQYVDNARYIQDSFNSRTPCGVRLPDKGEMLAWQKFQFTHPVWGATPNSLLHLPLCSVSIHAPRVGCDV